MKVGWVGGEGKTYMVLFFVVGQIEVRITSMNRNKNYECSIRCSYRDCWTLFSPKFEKEVYDNPDSKEYKIFKALMETRIFCLKHTRKLAELIYSKAQLPIESSSSDDDENEDDCEPRAQDETQDQVQKRSYSTLV
jgi:hypothetical protein